MKRKGLLVAALGAVALVAAGALAGRVLYRDLPGPGVALRRSGAQRRPLLGRASRRDTDGTEPGLQGRRGLGARR